MFFKIIVGTFLAVFYSGLVFVFMFFVILSGLPDVSKIENLMPKLSSSIYDSKGNVLYTIFEGENREKVSISEVSKYLIDATVTAEDENFFSHYGLDLKGISRAFLSNFFGVGVSSGGSTITQQFVKNAVLSSEKTYERKIKEAALALNLEMNFSKDEILEFYLNEIPYGNNAFGIKRASKQYFDTLPAHLTLAQSVVLASLPKAPSSFNPYSGNLHSRLVVDLDNNPFKGRVILDQKDLFDNEYIVGLIGTNVEISEGQKVWISGRSDFILDKMYENGLINLAERSKAYLELESIVFQKYKEEIKYPHFVFYVMSELEKIYGNDFLRTGGLSIYTSIDPDVQDFVENMASSRRSSVLRSAGADNMAILSVRAKTGEILAMLGSFDFFDENIDGNVNVVFRPRQPGSSFKPFVYAKAFLNGLSPSSRIYDTPMKIASKYPQNFDGNFRGEMSVRTALGQSRNIPAIRAYYLAGEESEIVSFVKKLGINSLRDDFDYGYPLAIGSGEVSLFEMVSAYSVFANNGEKIPISGINYITDSEGNVIYQRNKSSVGTVLDPAIAFLINNILSDRSSSIGGNLFVPGKITAAKSGTSTKRSKGYGAVRPGDLWTIGYSPSYVTGVWIGNTDGKGLNYSAEAYYTASPIFSAVMKELMKNDSLEPFPIPSGILPIWVSKKSGLLPAKETPKTERVLEYFAKDYFVQKVREIYKEPKVVLEKEIMGQ
jgi:membrane peptidoglycan carboxypeptidase